MHIGDVDDDMVDTNFLQLAEVVDELLRAVSLSITARFYGAEDGKFDVLGRTAVFRTMFFQHPPFML